MKNQHLYKYDSTEILVERYFSDSGCYSDIIKECLLDSVQNVAKNQKICYNPRSNASVASNKEDR